jgi:hypothetical protein
LGLLIRWWVLLLTALCIEKIRLRSVPQFLGLLIRWWVLLLTALCIEKIRLRSVPQFFRQILVPTIEISHRQTNIHILIKHILEEFIRENDNNYATEKFYK